MVFNDVKMLINVIRILLPEFLQAIQSTLLGVAPRPVIVTVIPPFMTPDFKSALV